MSISKSDPMVSIIIPVYNGSNFLREAIDSALAQTYGNYEIIVVNDGSSDNGATEQIILSYGDKVRYIAKKENGGVSSALNIGIENMRGEYFSWLSHDDKYSPEKIEAQVRLLDECEDKKALAICDFYCINAQSEKLSDRHVYKFKEGCRYHWGEPLTAIFERGSLHGCSLMIPKRAFEECGMFREDMRYCQDTQMWARMFIKGYSLLATEGKHVHARMHDKQLSQTGKSIFYGDCAIMADAILPDLLRLSEKDSNYLFTFAKFNAKYNNKEIVNDCIRLAKQKKLFSPFQIATLNGLKLYSGLRPAIRKLYYALFVRKVKTQG